MGLLNMFRTASARWQIDDSGCLRVSSQFWPDNLSPCRIEHDTFETPRNIYSIQNDMDIREDLDLRGPSASYNPDKYSKTCLMILPQRLRVGRDFYLGRNPELRHFPEDMMVGENIFAEDTGITAPSAGMRWGG